MNIYETFDNLRYHHENEVVEFFANKAAKPSARRQRTTSILMTLVICFCRINKRFFQINK